MGQGSSPGIGHIFELPFADATPLSNPRKRTQDEMNPRVRLVECGIKQTVKLMGNPLQLKGIMNNFNKRSSRNLQ